MRSFCRQRTGDCQSAEDGDRSERYRKQRGAEGKASLVDDKAGCDWHQTPEGWNDRQRRASRGYALSEVPCARRRCPGFAPPPGRFLLRR